MGEVVNLRRKRKEKARSARQQQAEENRRKFGQSRQEKELSEAKDALAAKALDGHKRDDA